ncbi:MAG TPA: MBL fold metallo-hydrolase [Pirellulales bacterium]|nr:MBL fold metallo-hydrolase [Pirellulales bacterium]
MQEQVPVSSAALADLESEGALHEIADDLAYQRLAIVNAVYWGRPDAGQGEWTLIDAGVMGSTAFILDAVERRFGPAARPAAMILTHGHFDHVGALEELAHRWDVPIFAHPEESPFLNGSQPYPPPDPSVGGGLMSALSRFYPRGPIDVSRWLRPLPPDGSVPAMPGWRWIHTPGHTRGHISLFRDLDRTLIAGDAFITTNQESAYAVAIQRTEIHGPPKYYTTDWQAAHESVERLAALEPELAVTGHGRALLGPEMRLALHTLARDFDNLAVPEQGRYVGTAAH